MSKFEIENGNGSIHKNETKKDGSNQPDYWGTMKTPDGQELKLALWLSTSKAGKKYFSLKAQVPQKPEMVDDAESDLPF